MRSASRKLVASLACVAAALVACSHPNRLDIPRANRQRDVISSRTPTDDERAIEGTVNGEPRKLSKWARRAAAGDTIECRLGPGLYVIDDPIVVKGVSLVIAGSGVDRTRIKLHSDDWRALSLHGCPNFELRGVTVAGYSGGGIDVHDCARVVVNDCDFVGSRYGLEIEASNAVVDSCVFAGNEIGLKLDGAGTTLIRGTCFAENWWSIAGSSKVEMLGCALFANEKGAEVLCATGSVVRSVLLGRDEGWSGGGHPRFESCVVGSDDVLEHVNHRGTPIECKPIGDLTDFPNALPAGLPPGCDVGAIHYAIERYRVRGASNASAKIDDTLRSEAEYYAAGARRAVAAKEPGPARELARLAHTYLLAMSPRASRAGFEDVEQLVSVAQ